MGLHNIEMDEVVWYRAPDAAILREDYLTVMFPSAGMTYAAKLNALFRLSLLYAVVVSLLRWRLSPFLVPLVVGAVTVVLYEGSSGGSEAFDGGGGDGYGGAGGACAAPTRGNPFMNPMPADPPGRAAAAPCDPLDARVSGAIDRAYRRGLFENVDDVWGKHNSERQFYTVPVTGVPNDQGAFAEWVYGALRCKGKNTVLPRSP